MLKSSDRILYPSKQDDIKKSTQSLTHPKKTKVETITTLSGQKLTKTGRIKIPKFVWPIRIITILSLSAVIIYNFSIGIQLHDPLIIFATLIPVEAVIMATIGWFFYKNPKQGYEGNELVSVIVPIYNQNDMIPIVIDAISNSTYKNFEIIAINDGSTDGTKEVLDNLAKKYPKLVVINKKNGGKRTANLAGFSKAKGKFLVFIDSDSVIDPHAISEFMKTFNGDLKVGALVGHANVWNSKKSLITKIQDSWYDFSFNIVKTSESTLGNVLVCSGCLAAYRREAIEKFVGLWGQNSQNKKNDENEEIKYFKSNPWINKKSKKISETILKWSSQFDDAEDSVLTSQTLVDWETKYVASAKVYTDVPENMRGFVKQQIRWKKGWVRASLFLMTFFWRKNPIIASVFYINFSAGFLMPLVMFIIFFYAPIVMDQWYLPIAYTVSIVLYGYAQGLDFKYRDPTTNNWKYKPLANIVTGFVLPWLMIPALLSIRKSQWMTR